MKTFIQILDGKAHWKFQAEARPSFAPDIHLVDVTALTPQPEEGWRYEEENFLPPDSPLLT